MTNHPQPSGSRPEHIEEILAGLDRYNPETVSTFQDYVQYQCENRTYDNLANLALLKLYQFNPHLQKDETITNILVKALTVFPSPDFSLCLHLLPPITLQPTALDPLSDAVRKLTLLNELLESASYREFWSTLEGDDLYADLVADCIGFEETMRIRIAMTAAQVAREIEKSVLGGWLNMPEGELDQYVKETCAWDISGPLVKIPVNKDNEARTTVYRENVQFNQFQSVIKRAFEQAA